MNTAVITVAKDFSRAPAGRFVTDGPFPGEVFRDKLLVPALQGNDIVTVDFDGTEPCGSSFLDEAFGGLVRDRGYSLKDLEQHLKVHSSRKSYEAKVWSYIQEAKPRTTA